MIFDTYFAKIAKAFSAPPKRTILSIDYETYSECDLRKAGASRYARDPSTEVLMLAYATRSSEVKQWVPAHGEPMPDDLRRAFADPSVTISAWNAPFEMAITKHVLGLDIPIWRWMDVMALAYSLALPGGLDQCGKVVGLPQDKQKMSRGKLLVRKFCVPRKPSKHKPWTRCTAETDPEEWQEFLEYNRQDVEAERSIYRKIKAFQMPDHEWDLWHLDQKINEAGIPINLDAVESAVRLSEETTKKNLAEMAEITGLANPNSGSQLLPWLRERGYWFEDLKKGHVERAADWFRNAFEDGTAELMGFDPDVLRVLELRLQVSKSSVKKYPALLAATDDDGALRGCHQFAGAGRTWRWSGRRFQPQNLSKPAKYLEDCVPEVAADIEALSVEEMWAKYNDPDDPRKNVMEALVAGVRPMVQAPEGHLLVDADLSAIENVVLGWLADDDKILRVFREGLDPYIDFAQDMFKMPYEAIAAEVKAGNKSKRTTAKPGVLGCGYMLGAGEARENPNTGEMEATGLLGYGWNMGVDLTPQMAKLSVDTFRAKFERVVAFWYDLDRACRRAITTKKPQVCGYLKIDIKGPFMRIGLPSGRFLHYWKPDLRDRKTPWGEVRKQITYEQVEMGQWRRVTTHPGKLTENVTQAVARDILAHGMTLADRRGLDLRLHVHDQSVGVSPIFRAERDLNAMIECLTTRPSWANAKLPLKAAGFVSPVFLKD
jgi:DNA polymerase